MKMKFKSLLGALSIGVVALSAQVAHADAIADIKAAGVLKVAVKA
jgi:hypothetical protein